MRSNRLSYASVIRHLPDVIIIHQPMRNVKYFFAFSGFSELKIYPGLFSFIVVKHIVVSGEYRVEDYSDESGNGKTRKVDRCAEYIGYRMRKRG